MFLLHFFYFFLLCYAYHLVMFVGGRSRRQSSRRKPSIWFFVLVLLAAHPLLLFLSPAMSREGSPAAVVLRLSEVSSNETLFCHRQTSNTDDLFQAPQSLMEYSMHRVSKSFLFLGKDELENLSLVAPPHTRCQICCVLRPDPVSYGRSSIFLNLRVMRSYFEWRCLHGCHVLGRQSVTSISCYRSDQVFNDVTSTIKLTRANWFNFLPIWVWPRNRFKFVSLSSSLPKNTFLEEESFQPTRALVNLVSVKKIPGRFLGIYTLCTSSYLFFGENLPMGSSGSALVSSSSFTKDILLPSYLLSWKEDVFSVFLPSISSSLLTGLLSCGAVCTGPEDAIESNLIFLVGESWFSTSLYVTIFQLSDFVVKALSTHLSFGSNSLSTSHEELSFLALFANVVYCLIKEDVTFPPSIVAQTVEI